MPRSLDPVCQDLKSAIKKLDKVWKMTRKVQHAIVIGVKLCVVAACSQQSLFQVFAVQSCCGMSSNVTMRQGVGTIYGTLVIFKWDNLSATSCHIS